MLRINKAIFALASPAVLSAVAVLRSSAVVFGIMILAHFIIIGAVPAFRRRESIWMFIVVALSSVPLNVYILTLLNGLGFIFGISAFLGILRCILYYSILFSVEQLIMGVITRIIWKRQYKLTL